MSARIRTRFLADDGREFVGRQAEHFCLWVRDTRAHIGQDSSLDAEQCQQLWRALKCQGAAPKRLTFFLNRQDVSKALLQDMPARGRA